MTILEAWDKIEANIADDEGPLLEGWQSDELMDAIDIVRALVKEAAKEKQS